MVKIFIDPGHGGADPGAIGNGLQEKDLTLKISQYAKNHLETAYEGAEVLLSRSGDEPLTLAQRTNKASAWGAQVVVSIHINGNLQASGFESFVDAQPIDASLALQNIMHPEIMQVVKAFGIEKDRGKKRGNLHMVRVPEQKGVPSVLTENLFIGYKADAERLKNEDFLKAVGEAHARGIAKFKGLKEKVKAAAVTVPPEFFSATDVAAKVKALKAVNIYSAPSEQSAIVRQAVVGEEFMVYFVKDDWHNVGGANWIKGGNGTNLSLLTWRVVIDNLMYPQARDLVPELQKRFGDKNVWGELK